MQQHSGSFQYCATVVDMTWSNEQCAMPLRSSFRKKIYCCRYRYKISPESAVWRIMGGELLCMWQCCARELRDSWTLAKIEHVRGLIFSYLRVLPVSMRPGGWFVYKILIQLISTCSIQLPKYNVILPFIVEFQLTYKFWKNSLPYPVLKTKQFKKTKFSLVLTTKLSS